MAMKLKTVEIDGKQYAEVADGHPVFVHDDGKEIPFDAAQAMNKISQLNGEARGHRERAEAAEGKLKGFEGIDNPADAIKALQTVKNLNDKQLVDAGEVERIKTEAIAAVEGKYKPVVAERDKLQNELITERIGGSFSRSKYISDKLAIPADLVQARFGQNFKLEGGKVVAYDGSGNKLFSRANPGDPADFDEALELLVQAYPHRDTILKSTEAGGGGARNNPGGGGAGAKTITRAQFDGMSHQQRHDHITKGGTVTD